MFIQNNSLEKLRHKNCVIPAKAGIQMIKQFPTQVGQHIGFVRFAEHFSLLDSGLRRNDGLMDYLGLLPDQRIDFVMWAPKTCPPFYMNFAHCTKISHV